MSGELFFICMAIFFLVVGLSIFILGASQESEAGVGLSVPVIVISSFCLIFGIHMHGYRGGQIDAINGKIKYELVEQPDGTKEWDNIPASQPG